MRFAERLAELGLSPEIIAQAETIEDQADDFRRLTHARGGLNLTQAANFLGVGPRRLIGWMIGHGWIYRKGDRLEAYSPKVAAKLLFVKVLSIPRVDGTATITAQVLVTAAGLARLAREMPTDNPKGDSNG
jgi:anti-repressor protein